MCFSDQSSKYFQASKIFGVATFYNQFRFTPKDKYYIEICRGPACHVKGSAEILTTLERELEIKAGQTTRDSLFSLAVVDCIGACGLASVIVVNSEFYADMNANKTSKLIQGLRSNDEQSN